MNLEKLKDTARKHEQKEDWQRAIDVYLKAIQEFESGRESAPDLSLYNRVGDLHLKLNDPAAAVRSYERAADLYADQGFLNNAIALCGKILRVNPGRVQTHLKLAQMHARKNVVTEAKRHLIEYIERMNALNQLDDAFRSVKSFADQFSSNQDIRLMLVELLRAASRDDEAREQLEKIAAELESRGDRDGARATRERLNLIEIGLPDDAPGAVHNAPVPPAAAPSAPQRHNDLVFLDTGIFSAPARAVEPAKGLEVTPEITADADQVAPAEGFIASESMTFEEPVAPMADLEGVSAGDLAEASSVPVLDGLVLDSAAELDTSDFEPTGEARLDDELLAPAEYSGEDYLGSDDVTAIDLAADDLAIERPVPIELGDVDSIEPMELDPPAGEELVIDYSGLDGGPTLEGVTIPDEPWRAPAAHDDFSGDIADLTSGGVESVEPLEDDPAAPELPYIAGADLVHLAEAEPPPAPLAGHYVASEPADEGPSVVELEDAVLDDPSNPAHHRALADALLTNDETERAREEYELALEGFVHHESWHDALDAVDALIWLDPDSIRFQQKRVELTFRIGDRGRLLDAYLHLGDTLAREGALDKALAVYGRVIEHEPDNVQALSAIATLEAEAAAAGAPPAPAPPVSSAPAVPPAVRPAVPAAAPPPSKSAQVPAGFVDLGSLILETSAPRDMRMRVVTEQPTGDEQRDFEDTLAQFKRGIEANISTDDYQTHYDLGVAFREMGLLDEAIAEFQKALRAPDGRLRTSEALGLTFYDKGQYAIAETILRRAIDTLDAGDDEKIGALYWLGRSCEAQEKRGAAITSYERALAVDIRFMDLSERIRRLGAGQPQ